MTGPQLEAYYVSSWTSVTAFNPPVGYGLIVRRWAEIMTFSAEGKLEAGIQNS